MQKIQNYDKVLAYIGIITGCILNLTLFLNNLYHPIGLVLTIQMTCVSYLWLRNHLNTSIITKPVRRVAQKWNVIFIVLVTILALVTVFVSVDSLERPLWIFIVLSIIPSLIVVQYFFLQPTENILIVEVAVLAIAIALSGITVFPHNGGDTWAHLDNANIILKNKTVQAILGSYHDYPLYPAIIAVLSSITQIDIVKIALFLNCLVAILCPLLMFYLSSGFYKSLYQRLILVLLILGSKWFIYWLMMVVSMAVGMLIFYLLIAFLFHRSHSNTFLPETIILLLVIGFIPFFHPIITMAGIFLLSSIWSINVIFSDNQQNITKHSLIGLVIYIIIVMLSQWMYYGEYTFFNAIRALVMAIFREESTIGLAVSYRNAITYTLDSLNFFFLLSLAGLEILRQVQIKTNELNFYTGITGCVFLVFGYTVQFINFQEMLPHRWLLFSTLLLVFPASSTFVQLLQDETKTGRIVSLILVTIYFFTGLTNTEANRDQPLYDKTIAEHYELTDSEYMGLLKLEEIIQIKDVPVRVDFRLWDYLKLVDNGKNQVGYWQKMKLNGFNGIFPIRNVYFERYSLIGNPVFDTNYDPSTISKFYDSGDMQLLEKTAVK